MSTTTNNEETGAGCGAAAPTPPALNRDTLADYLRTYRAARRWRVIVSPGGDWHNTRTVADDLSWEEAKAIAERKDAEWFAAHPLHSSWTADLHFVEESQGTEQNQTREEEEG